jgi:hypothetical protein
MKRALNEIEFFMWTIGELCNNILSCRFYGSLSPERLRAALARVQQKHPLLAVTIIVDDAGLPWFSSDGVSDIPLNIYDREGDDHVVRAVERELSLPFSLQDTSQESRLPLVRVTWFRPRYFEREPSDLLFTLHHAVADGLSLIYIFRDLLGFLTTPNQPVQILDITKHISKILPADIQDRIPHTARKFKRWLKLFKLYQAMQFSRIKEESRIAGLSFKITSGTFPEDLTQTLLLRCKNEGVTVHAALGAVFSRSFSILASPTNLRDRLAVPVGDAVGLFATGSTVRMKFNPKRPFWDNARRYQKKLRKSLQNRSLFFIYTLFNKLVVPLQLFKQFW